MIVYQTRQIPGTDTWGDGGHAKAWTAPQQIEICLKSCVEITEQKCFPFSTNGADGFFRPVQIEILGLNSCVNPRIS